MDEAKKVSIQNIVDREIKKFADSYEARFEQYKKSSEYIKEALERIKVLYFK